MTSSSWSEKSNSNNHNFGFNYYSDECLLAAGGKSLGVLDFYQIHTYRHSSDGNWEAGQPMVQAEADYSLLKPLVIGEFASACSAGDSAGGMFEQFYENGYSGAWAWQMLEGDGHCQVGGRTKRYQVNS